MPISIRIPAQVWRICHLYPYSTLSEPLSFTLEATLLTAGQQLYKFLQVNGATLASDAWAALCPEVGHLWVPDRTVDKHRSSESVPKWEQRESAGPLKRNLTHRVVQGR